VEVWERTSQVVVFKVEPSHIPVGRIASNTEPIGSARIRRKVPVGVVGPERAASGVVKSDKRLLLGQRKGAPNRKNQGEEQEQQWWHGGEKEGLLRGSYWEGKQTQEHRPHMMETPASWDMKSPTLLIALRGRLFVLFRQLFDPFHVV
jgi:hypothetical protein